ncbi:MAG: beta-propeller fold lactonase family protein [Pseudolabrys sp.]
MTTSTDKKSTDNRDRPIAAFVSVGPRLIHYDLDVENAALVQRESITLPENIQYAWPHASGDYLYVASSNGGPGGTLNNRHFMSALRIDPATRALAYHGKPVSLPSRPIHITVDAPSDHALVAYNQPSGLTVHRLNGDGTVGELVKQEAPLDFGIYPHQ